MKINYRNFNINDLGGLFIVGILLLIVVSIVAMVISPLLTTMLPKLFVAPLGLTDTLLFLILITLVVRK